MRHFLSFLQLSVCMLSITMKDYILTDTRQDILNAYQKMIFLSSARYLIELSVNLSGGFTNITGSRSYTSKFASKLGLVAFFSHFRKRKTYNFKRSKSNANTNIITVLYKQIFKIFLRIRRIFTNLW